MAAATWDSHPGDRSGILFEILLRSQFNQTCCSSGDGRRSRIGTIDRRNSFTRRTISCLRAGTDGWWAGDAVLQCLRGGQILSIGRPHYGVRIDGTDYGAGRVDLGSIQHDACCRAGNSWRLRYAAHAADKRRRLLRAFRIHADTRYRSLRPLLLEELAAG